MDNEVAPRNATLENESVLTGARDFLRRSPPDIEGAINKIEANWSKKKSRSTQNWRLLHVPLEKSSGYNKLDWRKSEVLLERMICSAGNQKKRLIWNQMPAASGLLPLPPKREDGKRRIASEGRRSIDLVYQPNDAEEIYEFLELKIRRKDGSADSLRHAALEILEYGLLYLFSRKNREVLGYANRPDKTRYAVLGATEIRLRVLAGEEYYAAQNRSEVSVSEINRALAAYIAKDSENFKHFKMTFGFQVLGDAPMPFEAFVKRGDFSLDETNA